MMNPSDVIIGVRPHNFLESKIVPPNCGFVTIGNYFSKSGNFYLHPHLTTSYATTKLFNCNEDYDLVLSEQ